MYIQSRYSNRNWVCPSTLNSLKQFKKNLIDYIKERQRETIRYIWYIYIYIYVSRKGKENISRNNLQDTRHQIMKGSVLWGLRPLTFLQGISLVTQMVKNLPAMQETVAWSLGWEDPLEKGVPIQDSILVWRNPWAVGPDRLQSMASQRLIAVSEIKGHSAGRGNKDRAEWGSWVGGGLS